MFLQTWLKLDKIRFVEGSALPWLLVVATNITSKMVRTRGRDQRRLLTAGRPDLPAEFADRVAESVDAHRQIGDAANFIAGLPKRDKLVVSLCDLGSLSHAEAAAVLGIPVGTVKSRLFRVHQKLRQALDEHNRPLTSSLEGQLDA